MNQKQVCDICGNKSFKLILDNQLPSVCSGGEIVQNSIPLRREECQHCGFIKTLTSPLDMLGDNYYKSTYSAKLKDSNYDFVNFAFNKNFVEVLNDFVLAHDFKTTGTLLDIGCGKGKFEKAFLEKYPNWKAIGIDPSEKSIEIAQQSAPSAQFILDKYNYDLFKTEKYDLIAMHTILNRVSPAILIQDAGKLLNIGGVLSVQIAIFEQTPFQFYFADHPYLYDYEHLCFIAAKNGLFPIKMDNNGNLTRVLFEKRDQSSEFTIDTQRIFLKNQTIITTWKQIISELSECSDAGMTLAIYGAGTTAAMLISQSGYDLKLLKIIFDDNAYKIGETFLDSKIESFDIAKAKTVDRVLLCAGPDGILRMKEKVNLDSIIGYGI